MMLAGSFNAEAGCCRGAEAESQWERCPPTPWAGGLLAACGGGPERCRVSIWSHGIALKPSQIVVRIVVLVP